MDPTKEKETVSSGTVSVLSLRAEPWRSKLWRLDAERLFYEHLSVFERYELMEEICSKEIIVHGMRKLSGQSGKEDLIKILRSDFKEWEFCRQVLIRFSRDPFPDEMMVIYTEGKAVVLEIDDSEENDSPVRYFLDGGKVISKICGFEAGDYWFHSENYKDFRSGYLNLFGGKFKGSYRFIAAKDGSAFSVWRATDDSETAERSLHEKKR